MQPICWAGAQYITIWAPSVLTITNCKVFVAKFVPTFQRFIGVKYSMHLRPIIFFHEETDDGLMMQKQA